jgi:NRAMP (natural resistance-associated macrophage protein)-like metal ion transporter
MVNLSGAAPRKMDFLARFFYRYRRFSKALRLFLMIAGPGIIVMVADNDAGGITTYAVTGSNYGYALIWFMILLGPIAYVVQEMCVRLGATTKRGFAEVIFDSFGSFWGWFSLLDLTLTDFLTIVTEFIGMTTALAIFHIPPIATVIVVIVLIMAMVMQGRYWTWEKIVLVFCILNVVYIPAALLVHPSVSDVLKGGLIPNLAGGFSSNLFFLLMANIGTTIAPWMLFFHQSSVVDKGLQEKDIRWERVDTALGALATIVVAASIIIVTGTVLKGVPIESAAEAAVKLMDINHYVGTLMAIGLFDAGLLGAICISLASSWALGEVFGWAHSLNSKVKQAPWFTIFRLFILVGAGTVVLLPNAPLVLITLFVQVVAVTLLPAALVFLIILLNNKEIAGKFKNTLTQNILASAIVGVIIILSTAYAITTIFPNLIK